MNPWLLLYILVASIGIRFAIIDFYKGSFPIISVAIHFFIPLFWVLINNYENKKSCVKNDNIADKGGEESRCTDRWITRETISENDPARVGYAGSNPAVCIILIR